MAKPYDPEKPITATNWPENLRMPPRRQQQRKVEKKLGFTAGVLVFTGNSLFWGALSFFKTRFSGSSPPRLRWTGTDLVEAPDPAPAQKAMLEALLAEG
ncbi:hypothetical protein OV203_26125 [Nannocystis sp. ILAH1]|uniref:hypothetical protein n=1 Tax=Nannocystis sp. ILAH1 TaxID=2996789 RepID=UPI0022700A35|nr:hypothetical protein [Nannocystis sp. ILAH1]MCY0990648.1 hypothetical protein [Nannocystis sp. ILAH1]